MLVLALCCNDDEKRYRNPRWPPQLTTTTCARNNHAQVDAQVLRLAPQNKSLFEKCAEALLFQYTGPDMQAPYWGWRERIGTEASKKQDMVHVCESM